MTERGDLPGPVEREITAALRASFGDPPADVDWETMSARIGDAARFRLAARRRRPAGWSAAASRWSRIAVPAALAASWGFMLPAGTGPNAIAWATGRIALPRMVVAGFALDVAGVFLLVGTVWGISLAI